MSDRSDLVARLENISRRFGHFSMDDGPGPEVGDVIREAIAALTAPPAQTITLWNVNTAEEHAVRVTGDEFKDPRVTLKKGTYAVALRRAAVEAV